MRLLIACALFLGGCAAPDIACSDGPIRLLVKLRPGAEKQRFDDILRRHGARAVHEIPKIHVQVVELAPDASPQALADELRQQREVESVEIDARLPPAVRSSTPRSK